MNMTMNMKLAHGHLHLVVTARDVCVQRVAAACRGGVDAVHLKGTAVSDAYVAQLRGVLGPNPRVALIPHLLRVPTPEALLVAADAAHVHCPAEVVDKVGSLYGDAILAKVRGASCHSVEEAHTAFGALPGLEYLLAGTMYATPSHPGKVPESPRLLSAIRHALRDETASPPRLAAIGGITHSRVDEVCRHGASGVAVIRDILAAPCPATAAAQLKAALATALRSER